MKRLAINVFLVLLLILCFSGCANQQVTADLRTLSFPGTTWDMTPEELIDSLSLDGQHYSIEETEKYYSLNEVHMELFGSDAEIIFAFEDLNKDGIFHLRHVYAAYPDETDFDSVLSSMKKLYGEPENGNVYSWESEGTYKDFMTEDDLTLLGERADAADAGPQEWIEDSISFIFLHINSTRYKAYYNGALVSNMIEFTSAVSSYTQEGGYSAMFPDS